MRTYEPFAGECISETAKRIVALANETGDTVQVTFNDIIVTANPGDNPDEIEGAYSAEMKRRHDEYIASPEYAEQCHKADEEKIRKYVALQEALATAPAQMSFKDEAGWKRCVAMNSDPYGAATIQFADRWARIMEARIAKGESLAGCADDACSLADNEGITGFMYGCAVSILSHVWLHGEALRQWHNLKMQIGTEGEKANESGGVLNPAILTMGTQE